MRNQKMATAMTVKTVIPNVTAQSVVSGGKAPPTPVEWMAQAPRPIVAAAGTSIESAVHTLSWAPMDHRVRELSYILNETSQNLFLAGATPRRRLRAGIRRALRDRNGGCRVCLANRFRTWQVPSKSRIAQKVPVGPYDHPRVPRCTKETGSGMGMRSWCRARAGR